MSEAAQEIRVAAEKAADEIEELRDTVSRLQGQVEAQRATLEGYRKRADEALALRDEQKAENALLREELVQADRAMRVIVQQTQLKLPYLPDAQVRIGVQYLEDVATYTGALSGTVSVAPICFNVQKRAPCSDRSARTLDALYVPAIRDMATRTADAIQSELIRRLTAELHKAIR